MTTLVSLRLEPEIRKRLDNLAIATERSRASIAAEAVKQYIDLQEWQIAAIQKGVDEANRGEFISGNLGLLFITFAICLINLFELFSK